MDNTQFTICTQTRKVHSTPNSDDLTLPDSDHTMEHKTLQNVFQFQHALQMSRQSVPPDHLLVQELWVHSLFPVTKHLFKSAALYPLLLQH
jgi:uncharacterized protein (DUF2236 family)